MSMNHTIIPPLKIVEGRGQILKTMVAITFDSADETLNTFWSVHVAFLPSCLFAFLPDYLFSFLPFCLSAFLQCYLSSHFAMPFLPLSHFAIFSVYHFAVLPFFQSIIFASLPADCHTCLTFSSSTFLTFSLCLSVIIAFDAHFCLVASYPSFIPFQFCPTSAFHTTTLYSNIH